MWQWHFCAQGICSWCSGSTSSSCRRTPQTCCPHLGVFREQHPPTQSLRDTGAFIQGKGRSLIKHRFTNTCDLLWSPCYRTWQQEQLMLTQFVRIKEVFFWWRWIFLIKGEEFNEHSFLRACNWGWIQLPLTLYLPCLAQLPGLSRHPSKPLSVHRRGRLLQTLTKIVFKPSSW